MTELVEDTLSSLELTLVKPWDEIVVDVGSAGKISNSLEEGTLLVLIDPRLNPQKLDWGENENLGGKVIALPATIQEVSVYLEEKADRVEMIAPDPEESSVMVESAMPILKVGGEMVIVFDRSSNKAHLVNDKIKEITGEAKNLGYGVEYHDGEDLGEILGGVINSDIIEENAKILVLTKLR